MGNQTGSEAPTSRKKVFNKKTRKWEDVAPAGDGGESSEGDGLEIALGPIKQSRPVTPLRRRAPRRPGRGRQRAEGDFTNVFFDAPAPLTPPRRPPPPPPTGPAAEAARDRARRGWPPPKSATKIPRGALLGSITGFDRSKLRAANLSPPRKPPKSAAKIPGGALLDSIAGFDRSKLRKRAQRERVNRGQTLAAALGGELGQALAVRRKKMNLEDDVDSGDEEGETFDWEGGYNKKRRTRRRRSRRKRRTRRRRRKRRTRRRTTRKRSGRRAKRPRM